MKSKLLTALLSVSIALLMWLYVITVVSPDSDRQFNNIEIQISGDAVLKDRNLVIISGQLPKASLHLEGNRSDLNKINSSLIKLSVDVSDISEPGEYDRRLSQPEYLTNVSNDAFAVLSKKPGTVSIVVDRLVDVKVPVEVKWLNDEDLGPSGYFADKENKILDHPMVTITGPESVIGNEKDPKIAIAQIQVDLKDKTETFTTKFNYTLLDKDGKPVDIASAGSNIVKHQEQVELTLRIVRIKEVPLEVDVKYGGGATEENSKVTVMPSTIIVSGSDTVLEGLDVITLGEIDLEKILTDEIKSFDIVMPTGVTNESKTTTAQVDIKFPDLQLKEETVTNFQITNQPDLMDITIVPVQEKVQLRGSREAIAKLRPEHLTIVVDCTNATVGTKEYSAKVVVSIPDIHVVGTYTVKATAVEISRELELETIIP